MHVYRYKWSFLCDVFKDSFILSQAPARTKYWEKNFFFKLQRNLGKMKNIFFFVWKKIYFFSAAAVTPYYMNKNSNLIFRDKHGEVKEEEKKNFSIRTRQTFVIIIIENKGKF